MDICQHNRKDYLVIIDYYSRWVEIKQLTSLTSACVISRVKAAFITHGVPDVVVSDNGRQFVSDEFKRFADEMCFTQQTTNLYFAQENGMTERAVQTAKQILDLEDPEIGLLNYRATTHSAIGVPPSVALMGRLLATRLPVVDEQLKPRDHQDAGIRKSDREAKSTYKRYYDKRHGVRELPPLQTGDPVLLKLDNEKQWSQPSTVVRRDPINRLYIVQTGAGVNYRRNRRHLQGVPAVAPYVVDVEPDDGFVETPDIPAEPGVQPEPAVQVAPIAPPARHTRCGRLVRPPVRFEQLHD